METSKIFNNEKFDVHLKLKQRKPKKKKKFVEFKVVFNYCNYKFIIQIEANGRYFILFRISEA